MKFVIQTVNKQISHDFCFELLHAIEYWNWRNDNDIEYVLTDSVDFLHDDINSEWVPVGTIEFVKSFIVKYFNININDINNILKPINVPNCFLTDNVEEYTGRLVKNINSDNIDDINNLFIKYKKLFVKSTNVIKDINNGFRTSLSDNDINLQISTPITNIISEWRMFVYKNDIVGLQYYSGDFLTFPDIEKLNKLNTIYLNSKNDTVPPAYTMDLYVNETGTYVMECHEFYSCGLYGFSDYNVLPYMFNRTWNTIKMRIYNFLNNK